MKYFPWVFFSSYLLRKGSQWSNFVKVRRLLSRINTFLETTTYIFQGVFRKTFVLKFLEISQKSKFNCRVPFNQFSLFKLPPILFWKFTPQQIFLASVLRVFKIAGRLSLAESFFSEVAKGISAFCEYVGNCARHRLWSHASVHSEEKLWEILFTVYRLRLY